MSALEYYKNGTLKELYNMGIVTVQVFLRFKMYEYYVSQLISNPHSEAIKLTSDEFKVSHMTVRRAIETAQQ